LCLSSFLISCEVFNSLINFLCFSNVILAVLNSSVNRFCYWTNSVLLGFCSILLFCLDTFNVLLAINDLSSLFFNYIWFSSASISFICKSSNDLFFKITNFLISFFFSFNFFLYLFIISSYSVSKVFCDLINSSNSVLSLFSFFVIKIFSFSNLFNALSNLLHTFLFLLKLFK
jgi:hypothetical protein